MLRHGLFEDSYPGVRGKNQTNPDRQDRGSFGGSRGAQRPANSRRTAFEWGRSTAAVAPPLHWAAGFLDCRPYSSASGLRDSLYWETPRRRGTGTPRHRGTEAPRHRGTEAPGHRGTEAPGQLAGAELFAPARTAWGTRGETISLTYPKAVPSPSRDWNGGSLCTLCPLW